jgi:hypothetical protein
VKVIAVTGSGSGSGKTTLVCRILGAVPGLGAVKLSPPAEAPRIEWGPGTGGAAKDTARYSAAGARKVARVIGPRGSGLQLWEQVEAGMDGCRAVIVEGGGALQMGSRRFAILVAGRSEAQEHPELIGVMMSKIDLVIVNMPHPEPILALNDVALSHNYQEASVMTLDVEHGGGADFHALVAMISDFIGDSRVVQ